MVQFSIRLEQELIDRIDRQRELKGRRARDASGMEVEIDRALYVREAIRAYVEAEEKAR